MKTFFLEGTQNDDITVEDASLRQHCEKLSDKTV